MTIGPEGSRGLERFATERHLINVKQTTRRIPRVMSAGEALPPPETKTPANLSGRFYITGGVVNSASLTRSSQDTLFFDGIGDLNR